MRFNKKVAKKSGVHPVVHYNKEKEFTASTDRSGKYSFEGLIDRADKFYGSAKFDNMPKLFAYYDNEKKECRLCYQKCKPVNTQIGTVLVNIEDGMPHRVWIGKATYCKLSRGHDARCMKRQGKLDSSKGEIPQCVCVEVEEL